MKRIFTKEHRRKLSEAKMGKKFSDERKRKVSLRMMGHTTSIKTRNKISATLTGQPFTKERISNIRKSIKPRFGEESPCWKGDKVGYGATHDWLRDKFGNAKKCENANCLLKSHTFQWAKKTGREYTRNPDDYYQLCVSCHRLYDKGKITITI